MLKSHATRIIAPLLGLVAYYVILHGNFGGWKLVPPPSQTSKLTDQDSRQLLESSDSFRRQGQPEKALPLLQQLRAAYPQNHIYMRQMAEVYHQLGRFKEEAATWEDFLKVAPLPVEGCPSIILAYQRSAQAKESIDAAKRCVDIDPNNLDFSYYLGYSYELEKQFEKAVEVYSAAMPRDEKNMDLRVGLARTRMHQGNPSQALELAGEVLKHSPQNVDAMLVMGLSFWHQGNLVQARNYLEKGAAVAHEYTEFYVALGKIAEEENQKGKAKEAYSHALKLEPNNQDIAQRLQSLQEGVR